MAGCTAQDQTGNPAVDCDDAGVPSTCVGGMCSALPLCQSAGRVTDWFISGSTSEAGRANVIDRYSCGSGYLGNEVSYTYLADYSGLALAKITSTVDLDLLVLEGDSCNSKAACVGQSVTAGSGNETVKFQALAGKLYTIVVDSRSAAVNGPFEIEVESGRLCLAPVSRTVGCNQTVSRNTAGGTSDITYSQCTNGVGLLSGDPGPEDIWMLNTGDAPSVAIKLSQLSVDLDLQVLELANDANCSGYCSNCEFQNLVCPYGSGFNTNTADETLYIGGGEPRFLIVDSKTVGGPYQLEINCPSFCDTAGATLATVGNGMSAVSDGIGATSKMDTWACMSGTTGPENIFILDVTQDRMITFELTWSNPAAELEMLLLRDSCDSMNTCTAVGTGTGTSRTMTGYVTSHGYQGRVNYLVIESKNQQSTTFNVRTTGWVNDSCGPTGLSLGCTHQQETRRSDDPYHSVSQFSAWGPLATPCVTNATGREVVYGFDAVDDGSYDIDLTGIEPGKDLALVVTELDPNYRDWSPYLKCIAYSAVPGASAQHVTFAGVANSRYVVIVDGVNGDASQYNIALSGTKTAGGPACP